MSYSAIESRYKTIGVKVGSILVGGGAPIVVQSMTNTDTADAEATARQCAEMSERSCDVGD
jgi:(E)-4-hydroxy-3-methylbut-2-enyl-diphosphate synthase